MDIVQKLFIYSTFIVCCICLILLTVSLATDSWFVANPVVKREGVNYTSDGKFQGEVNFGLFNGKKKLNPGFGERTVDITIKETLKKPAPFLISGLWLFTVLSLALSMLFGLVGGTFAIINSVTTPVESITGIPGLYLWNGMGALFSLTAVVSWVVQYYLKLKINVMSKEELATDWDSEDRGNFGFSFFLVVVALILYVNNIITVTVIIKQPWKTKAPRTEIQKSAAGVIMLY